MPVRMLIDAVVLPLTKRDLLGARWLGYSRWIISGSSPKSPVRLPTRYVSRSTVNVNRGRWARSMSYSGARRDPRSPELEELLGSVPQPAGAVLTGLRPSARNRAGAAPRLGRALGL